MLINLGEKENPKPGGKSKIYPRGKWAKLENGTIVQYHGSHDTKECPIKYQREYLGKGTEYCINGVFQRGLETLHFWKNK